MIRKLLVRILFVAYVCDMSVTT